MYLKKYNEKSHVFVKIKWSEYLIKADHLLFHVFNHMANFSSFKIRFLLGNLSMVMAIFFLILGVDCKDSVFFKKILCSSYHQILQEAFTVSLQGENRSVHVPLEMLLVYFNASLKYQKGCLYRDVQGRKWVWMKGICSCPLRWLEDKHLSHHKPF